jgi:hypothetical protein
MLIESFLSLFTSKTNDRTWKYMWDCGTASAYEEQLYLLKWHENRVSTEILRKRRSVRSFQTFSLVEEIEMKEKPLWYKMWWSLNDLCTSLPWRCMLVLKFMKNAAILRVLRHLNQWWSFSFSLAGRFDLVEINFWKSSELCLERKAGLISLPDVPQPLTNDNARGEKATRIR